MAISKPNLLTNHITELLALLRKLEAHKKDAYYDAATEHNVTIGDGVNIDYTNVNHLKLVMNANGLIATADSQEAQNRVALGLPVETAVERQSRINNMVVAFQTVMANNRPPKNATPTQITAANILLQTELENLALSYNFTGKFSINETQSQTVVEQILQGANIPGVVENFEGKEARLDRALGQENITVDANRYVPHNSKEYMALMSMAYNGGLGLIGPKLKRAIATDNHAEAWFEIRYNTNSTKQNSDIRQGIAKRRYIESELFGLYDAGVTDASITDAQAKEAYQMFTLHREHILNYEVDFGEASTRNMRAEATAIDNSVQNLQDSLDPAYLYLFSNYVTVTDSTDFIDYRDIQVAAEGGDILVGTVRDGFTLGSGIEQNDLMIGSTAEDVLFSDSGNDLVYGEGGADSIDTGVGNDFVFGGTGMDDIEGGLGNDTIEGGLDADIIVDEGGDDTYIYNTGDGLDTITDKDGIGTIIYDGVTLIGGDRKISIDADYGHNYQDGNRYFSTDGLTTYRYIEGVLIINDTLIIKDFKDGDLGITLNDNAHQIIGTNLLIGDEEGQSYGRFYEDQSNKSIHELFGTIFTVDLIYGLAGDDDLSGESGITHREYDYNRFLADPTFVQWSNNSVMPSTAFR